MIDREAAARLADTAQGQYFLSSPEKLTLLVEAADIRPTDHVVEVGAGVGSVARALPPSASLTLIELDPRMTEVLQRNVPEATVIEGDALALIKTLPCDVLLSNLTRSATERLIPLLPELSIRTVIMATGADPDLEVLAGHFTSTIVTSVGGDDFTPPQPEQSLLVKLSRRVPGRF